MNTVKKMTNKPIRSLLSLGKIAVAGATIFGIGTLIVAQDPTSSEPGEVQAAKADITDFIGSETKSGKFTRAIESMGLRGRAYDFNGNTMYFASGYAGGTEPLQLMDKFQDQFVQYGVNKENHSDLVPIHNTLVKATKKGRAIGETNSEGVFQELRPNSQAMLSGDVVPVEARRDYVRMVGIDINKPHEEITDLYKDKDGNMKKTPIKDFMGGYKYVDATWEPNKDRTMITAVWSGDDFKGRRMDNTTFDMSGPDPDVPACAGCDRDFRFQSLNKDEPFNQNMWRTQSGSRETYEFYKSAMAARGWQETGVQPYIDRIGEIIPEVAQIQGRVLNMEKDGQSMAVTIFPTPNGRTVVMSNQQTSGVQSLGTAK